MIKNENTRITSVIPKKVYEKLAKEAEYEDRSISKMVAKILKDHYKIKSDD
ncbi:UNVERIFIED_ORG: hypothetical protein B2H98_05130 [Clostridium botulinum]|uniref:ribbon-helix-helix domain-containing protein n=1 Tax=Clostridium botulinum TaxID=1491 RepID=UPI0009B35EF5|nr:hypothetical protein [Clostridium botulinum]MBN1042346.1 hypothetical protein [Clostridium botulinum]NFG36584.1 hypothetical protein [Clostridium botulinum]NFL35524.1 hypothetical protein [Clostridium botulinum]NFM02552.1 hypothetical protein [Clostridium botulinum]NFN81188.1 hypothetical protein [Clostridium botulinum]